MTLTEFLALDYQGQMKATNQATYIDGRNEGEYMVLLYQLDGFYIEVYFDQIRCFISSFQAFEQVSQLDPYLKTIKIDLAI